MWDFKSILQRFPSQSLFTLIWYLVCFITCLIHPFTFIYFLCLYSRNLPLLFSKLVSLLLLAYNIQYYLSIFLLGEIHTHNSICNLEHTFMGLDFFIEKNIYFFN